EHLGKALNRYPASRCTRGPSLAAMKSARLMGGGGPMTSYTVVPDGLAAYGVEVVGASMFRSMRGFPTADAAEAWIAESGGRAEEGARQPAFRRTLQRESIQCAADRSVARRDCPWPPGDGVQQPPGAALGHADTHAPASGRAGVADRSRRRG